MHKLAVKLEGIERRKRTTGLLHVAAGSFLLLQTFDFLRLSGAAFIALLPFFAAALACIAYGLLKKRYDPAAKYNAWLRLLEVCLFALLAISFIPLGKALPLLLLFAWSIGCLLLMFTERKIFQDAEMIFNAEGIFIPGYFTNRRLFWSGIADVVLRPDFVTIFKTDESYLQYEVLKKMDAAALDEIILYCRTQLQARAAITHNH